MNRNKDAKDRAKDRGFHWQIITDQTMMKYQRKIYREYLYQQDYPCRNTL